MKGEGIIEEGGRWSHCRGEGENVMVERRKRKSSGGKREDVILGRRE